jgi:hypothetical protein
LSWRGQPTAGLVLGLFKVERRRVWNVRGLSQACNPPPPITPSTLVDSPVHTQPSSSRCLYHSYCKNTSRLANKLSALSMDSMYHAPVLYSEVDIRHVYKYVLWLSSEAAPHINQLPLESYFVSRTESLQETCSASKNSFGHQRNFAVWWG